MREEGTLAIARYCALNAERGPQVNVENSMTRDRKIKRFYDLGVHVSPTEKELEKHPAAKTAGHVTECFLAMLPPNCTLAGLCKVNVVLGRRLDEREPQFWQSDGIGMYYAEAFDVQRFLLVDEQERERMLLGAIEEALCSVAADDSEASAIHLVASRVRGMDFRCESEVAGLSRVVNGIACRVVREISRSGETWYVEVSSGQRVLLETNLHFYGGALKYHRAVARQGAFVILDHEGRETFRLAPSQ